MEFSIGDEVTIKAKMLNHGYEFDPTEVFTIIDAIDNGYCINAKIEMVNDSGKWIITKDDSLTSSVLTYSSCLLLAQKRCSRESIEDML